MTALLDLVNFNADASCLASRAWLAALTGGADSVFCRWLGLYTRLRKKVVLGLTGATIADLQACNPEAIAVIRAHPETFEVIARPFSHDIGLLRSRDGFLRNLRLGVAMAQHAFGRVTPFHLPPEFMLTNEQVGLLAEHGFRGVAINATRFAAEQARRIPREPYTLTGIGGATLRCLPVHGELVQAYLDALHDFDAHAWNEKVHGRATGTVTSWRDGESILLIPDGVARESAWLEGESGVDRAHLAEVNLAYHAPESLEASLYRTYPVHSFTAWMREFRMLGYVTRLQRLEGGLGRFDLDQLALWLGAINSDVLSAVEKDSPVVSLRKGPGSQDRSSLVLYRSERGFEGEELLVLLERLLDGIGSADFQRFTASATPAAVKFRARHSALSHLDSSVDRG